MGEEQDSVIVGVSLLNLIWKKAQPKIPLPSLFERRGWLKSPFVKGDLEGFCQRGSDGL
jgi:hypothetical protein